MNKIAFSKDNNPLLNTCTLSNSKGTKAVIYPMLGASLQQLYMDGTPIINNIIASEGVPKLLNSSCSAILFPFANRINKGQYSYANQFYQLDCNEVARGHAIHGLVYKQEFSLVGSTSTEDEASVSFSYQQDGSAAGFPFPFNITLTYTLKKDSLALAVKVENRGTASFPFSLGWHPYFYSSDLEQSELYMESEERIDANEQMIPQQIIKEHFPNPLVLRKQEFDTGFVLKNTTIGYKTPDYQMNLRIGGHQDQQFVQLYIPAHRKSIAIEPMTAAADCYNNNWGVKTLKPNAIYQTTWFIEKR
ncbi:aldose 1-epimerase [Aureispira anguillae]|uniref:Aldose 1-epimerase n=1 Tax=Aureispira anguillae TaxID=2864201 RepID=A0A915YJI8_9BACT|nr:aldose 1-epimerase [Aureispira anguillae]BDS14354.1 aldose 1-epimerase [Aureispira anguillae]